MILSAPKLTVDLIPLVRSGLRLARRIADEHSDACQRFRDPLDPEDLHRTVDDRRSYLVVRGQLPATRQARAGRKLPGLDPFLQVIGDLFV